MDIVRGRVNDIVFKHDASRIVQTIVRWGSPKQREEIALELKGTFKQLSQNKYSKVSDHEGKLSGKNSLSPVSSDQID